MSALLAETFVTSLLFGAITAGVPLLLAGLGEQISEKAGVLSIGIEGMMLLGAYGGFVAAFYTQSFWLGFFAGGASGVLVALLMALFCIWLSMNQIVIGIALTIGVQGLTALLHHFQFSRTYPRLSDSEALAIPLVSNIPVIGEALFTRHPLVYLAVLLVFVMIWVFRRTYVGLNLQAAGDKPAALDAAGVNVTTTRVGAVLATGFLPQEVVIRKLLGEAVAKKVGQIWGFDADGEMSNMWKRTAQRGLWFVGGGFNNCRTYSRYVALQIKAIEEGIIGPVPD